MKKLYIAGFVLAIAGCGGGGAGITPSQSTTQVTAATSNPTNSQPTTTISVPIVEKNYFNELKNSTPDLKYFFDNLCGNQTGVTQFISVDLNNDNRKDIIFGLWCGLPAHLIGTPYSGEIPHSLVILLQKSDGTFYLANEEIFGKKIVSTGGPGLAVTGDFNNDGKVDIFFAISKEDGRAYAPNKDGTSNWDANPYVLLSKGNSFELQKLPYSYINNFVKVIKGPNNIDEAVVGGKNFRYRNGSWQMTDNYYWVERPSTSYSVNNNNYVFTQVYNPTEFGISIWKQISDQWYQHRKSVFAEMKKARVLEPNAMTYSDQYLITLKGTLWLMPSFSESCVLEKNNLSTTFVIMFEGLKLDSYSGELLIMPNNSKNIPPPGKELSWSNYVMRLLKVRIENEQIVSYDWLDGEFSKILGLVCDDINGDKNNDINLLRWGNDYKPIVYTYANGLTNKISQLNFPDLPKQYSSGISQLVDINNDGKYDLVYLPMEIKTGATVDDYKIQIFVADKPLE